MGNNFSLNLNLTFNLHQLIKHLVLAFFSFNSVATNTPYHIPCPEFPSHRHADYPEDTDETIVYDSDVHLDIVEPKTVKTLKFETMPFAEARAQPDYDPAYSAPTRVLSKEGVKALKAIVLKHAHLAKTNPRQAAALRGLAYKSKFIRDMMSDQKLLAFYSKLAGQPVCFSSFSMGSPQANLGKISKVRKDVDKWHFDSVDFVMVIILSDMDDMVGGELEVLKMDLGTPEATAAIKCEGGPPRDKVE